MAGEQLHLASPPAAASATTAASNGLPSRATRLVQPFTLPPIRTRCCPSTVLRSSTTTIVPAGKVPTFAEVRDAFFLTVAFFSNIFFVVNFLIDTYFFYPCVVSIFITHNLFNDISLIDTYFFSNCELNQYRGPDSECEMRTKRLFAPWLHSTVDAEAYRSHRPQDRQHQKANGACSTG